MVATSGRGWRLAPSLVALVRECDRIAPNRSTASDGSIGDPAHAARTSDHNPDASGDVLAVDITDDKAGGCDADALAHHLVANRDPRLKYVIWNSTIVKSYGTTAWQPQPYTGANSHTTHTHISVLDTAAAKNDTSPWWPATPPTPAPPPAPPPSEEDEMANDATFIRKAGDNRVYLAGVGRAPRPVRLFKDAEYHCAREGITILNPPTDADEDVTDSAGTTRKVMVVNDGSLFGI